MTATDVTSKPVALSDFRGRYVVPEWTNPDCPVVQKHYNSGNMPATQNDAVAKGVAWVAIDTTDRPARGGTVGTALQAWLTSKNASPTASTASRAPIRPTSRRPPTTCLRPAAAP